MSKEKKALVGLAFVVAALITFGAFQAGRLFQYVNDLTFPVQTQCK